jgi:hypothetical protein
VPGGACSWTIQREGRDVEALTFYVWLHNTLWCGDVEMSIEEGEFYKRSRHSVLTPTNVRSWLDEARKEFPTPESLGKEARTLAEQKHIMTFLYEELTKARDAWFVKWFGGGDTK